MSLVYLCVSIFICVTVNISSSIYGSVNEPLSVSVFLYCLWFSISVSQCVSVYCLCPCIFDCPFVSTDISLYVNVPQSVYVSLSVYLSFSLCLYQCVPFCLCVSVYMSIMSICLCLSICLFYLYVSFYVSSSIYLCLSMYLCLCVSVNKSLSMYLALSMYFRDQKSATLGRNSSLDGSPTLPKDLSRESSDATTPAVTQGSLRGKVSRVCQQPPSPSPTTPRFI